MQQNNSFMLNYNFYVLCSGIVVTYNVTVYYKQLQGPVFIDFLGYLIKFNFRTDHLWLKSCILLKNSTYIQNNYLLSIRVVIKMFQVGEKIFRTCLLTGVCSAGR